MGLNTDIELEVKKILREQWTTRSGNVVPDPSSLQLGNHGVELEATILYADMADSTDLVDTESAKFSAEVYKSFLHAAAKIIRSEGGEITAYDGDRIMAVFIGDSKNTSAVRAGLKINWAQKFVINPSIKSQYPNKNYRLEHVVGIDTGTVMAARIGVRGNNDLVWVGTAANHAAKLTSINEQYQTLITKEVYDNMNIVVRITNGQAMWENRHWTKMNRTVYRSTWWWVPN